MANSISGKAAAGALITLSGTASATTYANLLGNYTFSGLAAGAYVITPFSQNLKFTPASSNQTIVATNITGVNFLAQSAGQAGSTFTVQNMVDKVRTFSLIEPIFNEGGWSTEPALTIATDVDNAIKAVNFPHKWNEIQLPFFYTFSWQQDYALINPDGTSVYGVEWLERGVAIDINNTSFPKPMYRIECGRSTQRSTGAFVNSNFFMGEPAFVICSYPNESLYYGTWGAADNGTPSMGNNPVAGSIYTPTLGTNSQPANPISQIQDANGNLWVLTGYGVESTAPLANANTLPGTTFSGAGAAFTLTSVSVSGSLTTYHGTITNGGTNVFVGTTFVITGFSTGGNNVTMTVVSNTSTTLVCATTTQANETHSGTATGGATVWTVVDPLGLGIRILEVPSQTGSVYQFQIVGQMPPVVFTSLNQTLAPLPDKYEPFFRAGFIAQCYRYSPEAKVKAKFEDEWRMWLQSLQKLREVQDRELEEYMFQPERTVMGAARSRNTYPGAGNPFFPGR
jgi:hypothetical protein